MLQTVILLLLSVTSIFAVPREVIRHSDYLKLVEGQAIMDAYEQGNINEAAKLGEEYKSKYNVDYYTFNQWNKRQGIKNTETSSIVTRARQALPRTVMAV